MSRQLDDEIAKIISNFNHAVFMKHYKQADYWFKILQLLIDTPVTTAATLAYKPTKIELFENARKLAAAESKLR